MKPDTKTTTLFVVVTLLGTLTAAGPAQAQNYYDDWEDYVPFPFHAQPTISVSYGLTNTSLKEVSQPLADPGFIQAKLGYARTSTFDYSSGILKHSFKHISVSYFSQKLGSSAEAGEIRSDIWRVGGTYESGYGYGLSSSPSGAAILLYHGSGWNWSDMTFKDPIGDPGEESLLRTYEDGIRFGSNVEAGVRIRLLPLLAADAAFERSIIFRRHLFWKWGGSALLEGGLQWLVDSFVRKIARSTPEAAPIVNLLLKGGLSYGLYEARRNNMNWPFSTEPPIVEDTFKFGLTFMF